MRLIVVVGQGLQKIILEINAGILGNLFFQKKICMEKKRIL
jgi:hypothetical protein